MDWLKFWSRGQQPLCRIIRVGTSDGLKYPPNIIRNHKCNIISFIPLLLFTLIVACSQFIPETLIEYFYKFWPLSIVVLVSMIRETVYDFLGFKNDKEINSQLYQKLTPNGSTLVSSCKIKVSDLIIVEQDQRVPADMILLKTTERNGSCFVRTNHLDGDIESKLKLATSATQEIKSNQQFFTFDITISAEAPTKDIHGFRGTIKTYKTSSEIPITTENTLWANTVLSSGHAIGLVIYTGKDSKSVLNNSQPYTEVTPIDLKSNQITRLLFASVLVLACGMVILKDIHEAWFRYWFRFVLLFSYMISVIIRMNLEINRIVYAYMIDQDKEVPRVLVSITTIHEVLNRITYLLKDKTATVDDKKDKDVNNNNHCEGIRSSNDRSHRVRVDSKYFKPKYIINELLSKWHTTYTIVTWSSFWVIGGTIVASEKLGRKIKTRYTRESQQQNHHQQHQQQQQQQPQSSNHNEPSSFSNISTDERNSSSDSLGNNNSFKRFKKWTRSSFASVKKRVNRMESNVYQLTACIEQNPLVSTDESHLNDGQ